MNNRSNKARSMIQNKRRILIIDDDQDILEILKLSLETNTNWEVLTAVGGLEGLKIALEARPDAIILDVIMPGMDGPTTVQRLQENSITRNIPVVLLTAKIQPHEELRYAELGVQAVLPKLINPLNFTKQLAEVFNW